MAKKNDRISVTKLTDAVKGHLNEVNTLSWNGLDITVRRYLELPEMLQFVDSVIKGCFNEDFTEYHPESRDFAKRLAVILFYTNLTMPSDYSKAYSILYMTDLMQCVTELIDKRQFAIIDGIIDEKISIAIDVDATLARQRVEEMGNAFNNLQNTLQTYTDGIDIGDVKSLISAFTGGAFDEQKLVDAVIKSRSEEE